MHRQNKQSNIRIEFNYLMVVGHNRVPCLLIFPTRIETRGMQKHLASIPTSDGSKCYSTAQIKTKSDILITIEK